MPRVKTRGIRVLFAARDENREHTEGLGDFLAVPVTGPEIVAAVERMLAERHPLARPMRAGPCEANDFWARYPETGLDGSGDGRGRSVRRSSRDKRRPR
jgi:hypothetical protein